MWIVQVALRRPYTFIVMALLILLATPLALLNMATDIFPEINIPVVSIIWNYSGLSAQEMGQRITAVNERSLTTTVSDIEHIESQSLAGIAIVKIFFQPNANIPTAVAQVVSICQAQLRGLPPGITPPLVIKYSASSIPVIQLGLSDPTMSEQQLFDTGMNFLRPRLVTIPGAAVPYPYGGKSRLISVDLDSAALTAKGLTPNDVVNAVNAQNLILPSGTAKIGTIEYNVALNGSPNTIAGLNDLPVRSLNGATTYLREVAHVRDGFLAADQHRAPGRPARRADLRPEKRRVLDPADRQRPARHAARGRCRACPRRSRSSRCSTSRSSSRRRSPGWCAKP
jgi:multidrug efflux pump subunit AcrB